MPEDAELAVAELKAAGYRCEWQRVYRREDFIRELEEHEYDIVLSDYSLPSFDGLSAVKILNESARDIPFILFSGMLGEEAAVEALRAGVTDFVPKDRLPKLPYVIERALQEKKEQRRARQAERQIHLQAAALESAANAIVITDPQGRVTFVNQAFAALTGFSPDEVVGQDLRILKSGVHDDGFYRDLWETIISGNVWQGELTNRRKDGTHYFEEQTITPVKNGSGEIINFISVKHDITARKHLEEQLRQAQKMEAVGLLAGGIAHDFNNLLTAITGYSSLALMKMPKEHPLRKNIEEIKGASERAAALTSQLLAFSRKQVLKPSVLNLGQVVADIEGLLRRITRENVQLVLEAAPGLGNVSADRGQIEQVVINLAINARDAMPDGGRLLIRTENVREDDNRSPGQFPAGPGPWVKLSVSDSGHGMDTATQQRIFEPFFTTKAVGKGTGLGLAMVHGTVTQSGGEIFVRSSVGNGTTFDIYLPCIDRSVQPDGAAAAREELPAGTETILLVEDEDAVRELVCEFLNEFGYTVLEAADAANALELYHAHRGRVHLLLTDVSMPGMSGVALKDEVLKMEPNTKVLLMSGYADDILRRSDPEGRTPLIEKPFTPEALAKRIREVLEQ